MHTVLSVGRVLTGACEDGLDGSTKGKVLLRYSLLP